VLASESTRTGRAAAVSGAGPSEPAEPSEATRPAEPTCAADGPAAAADRSARLALPAAMSATAATPRQSSGVRVRSEDVSTGGQGTEAALL
jgi:hypothetical protein